MSGCTVQRLEAPGLTFLKVSGTVDETFSASQLSGQIRADTILHLGKVTRFSSFGVREWVRLMKELQGRVKNCILVECSPAVVNQLNVVVDFAAGAHVKSIQLPYVCQNDELDKLVTVDVDVQRAELLSGTLPQVPCPQCKNPMVFDDLPGSYLAFLRDAAAPDAGSPMARFISSFEQAAPKLEQLDGGTAVPDASNQGPAAPATPAFDPTVKPDSGDAGRGGSAKWIAAAAVAAVVIGGGFFMFGRGTAPGPVVTPKPPDPVVTNVPPPPPAKQSMTAEQVLELNTMLSSERFSDAQAFVAKLEPTLLEESRNKAQTLVQEARSNAVEKHLLLARTLTQDGRPQQARDELDVAIALGGESDRALFARLSLERRAGNCPAVITAANAMAEKYADSSFTKQANDAKRACMVAPAIGPLELKHAMAPVKADIDGCLKAPRPADQTASTVDVAWTVNTSGSVTQAACTTPSLAKSALCQCLTEQVKKLHFTEKPGIQARRGSATFNTGTSG